MAVKSPVMAFLLLAACGGNPFVTTPSSGGGSGSGGTSVSDLPGTTNPTSAGSVTRSEDKNKGPDGGEVTGNGFAQGISYDSTADTFTVDNLAFDGGNVYTRSAAAPRLGPTNPDGTPQVRAFQASSTFADSLTGAQIDQFSYRALYGVSKTGRSNFAIVRTGAYLPYGFGGFVYNRTGGVTLPTTGQAKYKGTYAGLRDFDGVPTSEPKLEYTTGDMTMAIDFNDFNAAESGTGNGAGIQGAVTNRHVFDLQGNDITALAVAGINKDRGLTTTGLTQLPSLVFTVGPGVLDNNGEAEGRLTSTAPDGSGTVSLLEEGKYYAIISGSNADEVVGVLVVTSKTDGATARETGGFILYRP